MSDELETRLAESLALLPGPSPVAEARAREAALDALPQPRGRRLWPRVLVAAAAAVALLAAGAVALAALGTIHVVVGGSGPAPAPSRSGCSCPRARAGSPSSPAASSG